MIIFSLYNATNFYLLASLVLTKVPIIAETGNYNDL